MATPPAPAHRSFHRQALSRRIHVHQGPGAESVRPPGPGRLRVHVPAGDAARVDFETVSTRTRPHQGVPSSPSPSPSTTPPCTRRPRAASWVPTSETVPGSAAHMRAVRRSISLSDSAHHAGADDGRRPARPARPGPTNSPCASPPSPATPWCPGAQARTGAGAASRREPGSWPWTIPGVQVHRARTRSRRALRRRRVRSVSHSSVRRPAAAALLAELQVSGFRQGVELLRGAEVARGGALAPKAKSSHSVAASSATTDSRVAGWISSSKPAGTLTGRPPPPP
ncbi:hypothetical protein STENM327S_07819 [Streptomyces tendae]